MSLVNDMLRNLEQRHAADTPLPNEVRPLPAEPKGLPWWPLAWLVVLGVGGAGAVFFLRGSDAPPPATTVAAAPPMAKPAPPPPSPLPAAPVLVPVEPPPAPQIEAALPAAPPAPATRPARPVAAAKDTEPGPPPAKRLERPPLVPRDLHLDTTLSLPERAKSRAPDKPAAPVAADKPPPESDPVTQAEADLRRARELLAQGARSEAEALFKQGLARLPAQTSAAMTLARLQVDRGDSAAAWETLQTSLAHAQQDGSYRAFCGTVLQRLNRSREAADHYHAALRINPGEGRWWIGLGLALEGAGRMAEARDAFQRARASGNLPPEMAAFAEQKSR